MARLAFYDYYNMIAILEKYEHNQDFHQIVDFVETSHISLKARIKVLEDKDRGVAEQSGDDAPITGRRLDEGEEAAERVMVPTAAKVVTATVSIPTGSGVVSTASPIIPTAALIFTTATESTI
nr:hypothetical protein [Tanacetum cinerariifolium]